jgi:radical SAM protein with 4Fe4S-binding SPASM domain
MKDSNELLIREGVRRNVGRLRSYPKRLQILPTMRCNYRCLMCFQPEDMHKNGPELDFAIMKKIEIILPYVKSVYFTGGEPLLYHEYDRMLGMLQKYKCDLSISTNGALMSGKRLEMLCNTMHTVKISLDAATPDTYAKIRRGGDFSRVVSNIIALQKFKLDNNAVFPLVHLSMVVMKSNIAELSRLVVLAHGLGVTSIRVAHVTISPWQTELAGESLELHKEESDLQMMKAAAMARELGVELILPSLFHPAKDTEMKRTTNVVCYDTGVCTEPWEYLLIEGDGRTAICCSNAVASDNITDKSFGEVWNSLTAQRIRRQLNTAEEPPECANCLTYKRNKASCPAPPGDARSGAAAAG